MWKKYSPTRRGLVKIDEPKSGTKNYVKTKIEAISYETHEAYPRDNVKVDSKVNPVLSKWRGKSKSHYEPQVLEYNTESPFDSDTVSNVSLTNWDATTEIQTTNLFSKH